MTRHQRERQKGEEEGQTYKHKRHVHKNAVLLTPGLGLKLKFCPLPGEAGDTELPLTPP